MFLPIVDLAYKRLRHEFGRFLSWLSPYEIKTAPIEPPSVIIMALSIHSDPRLPPPWRKAAGDAAESDYNSEYACDIHIVSLPLCRVRFGRTPRFFRRGVAAADFLPVAYPGHVTKQLFARAACVYPAVQRRAGLYQPSGFKILVLQGFAPSGQTMFSAPGLVSSAIIAQTTAQSFAYGVKSAAERGKAFNQDPRSSSLAEKASCRRIPAF